MRQGIHPEYTEVKATCSCGNIIVINSTLNEDISLDVCSACHPFYTGKQKLVDTGGRVERFEKRFGKKGKTENKKKEESLKEPKADAVDQVKAEEVEEKAPKKEAAKNSTSKKEPKKEKQSKRNAITHSTQRISLPSRSHHGKLSHQFSLNTLLLFLLCPLDLFRKDPF